MARFSGSPAKVGKRYRLRIGGCICDPILRRGGLVPSTGFERQHGQLK